MDREDLDTIEGMRETAGCFARIFSTPDGKRALDHLKERFHVNDTTLAYDDAGRLDPAKTAAQEGQRSVVLYIADLADFDFSAANELIAGLRQATPRDFDIGV